jgi:metal-responsive CopG/Arc/MetJ family transcriptional regulator
MTRVGNRARKVAKITISVPEETLAAIERECRDRQETRSEFFRHGAEALLRQRREREAVECYLRGYREQPEDQDEVAAGRQTAVATLAQVPWE